MRVLMRRAARRALAIYCAVFVVSMAICYMPILFDLFWWARNPR